MNVQCRHWRTISGAPLQDAFPDLRTTVEAVVAEGDLVAVRWTATGTHRAEFFGIVPSVKLLTFRGIEIVRVEGEQIVERWGEWNGIELLRQLGAF